jgi:diguanylate cyclase (GGDEF)-like protein
MTRVLIVDDIQDNLELLRGDLEDDGYEVTAATSGPECLKAAQVAGVDAILLDLNMPGMNGKDTLRRLKSSEGTSGIPVIMVSANDEEADVIGCLDLGAQDYVSKPYAYPILAARLRGSVRLVEQQRQLATLTAQLVELATTDGLTGASNRRHFTQRAAAELACHQRSQRAASLLLFDADHFKHVNDTLGHATGDLALQVIAQALCGEARDADLVGRIGGEEFAICCPDTDAAGAAALAERIRARIERTVVRDGEPALRLTVSVGVTTALAGDDLATWLARADRLMYQAKSEGRNRVVCG